MYISACVAAFGFLWLFALPFQTLLLIRLDPTRRAAMQLGAAQLLGSSAGPLAASLVVGDGEVPVADLLGWLASDVSQGEMVHIQNSSSAPRWCSRASCS